MATITASYPFHLQVPIRMETGVELQLLAEELGWSRNRTVREALEIGLSAMSRDYVPKLSANLDGELAGNAR